MATLQNNISLIIRGTQMPKEGVSPLVAVGAYPSSCEPKVHNMLLKEPLTYVLRHTPTLKCYTLIDRTARPYGSPRPGILCVSIAISRGMQLTQKQSPYTLLQEIYQTFVALNMWAVPTGGHIFNEGDYDQDIFRNLLQKYRLEPAEETDYVIMNSSGDKAIVSIADEQRLAELMRDSQYPEFRLVSEVEIGKECASTVKIEIPRRIKFPVFINGKNTGVMLSEPNEIFDSSKYLRDTKEQTYEHVKFSLGRLLAAPGKSLAGGRVQLKDRTIVCNIPPRRKGIEYTAGINGTHSSLSHEDEAQVKKLLRTDAVQVFWGVHNISKAFVADDKRIIIYNKEEEENEIRITPSHYEDFDFTVQKLTELRRIVIGVKVKEKSKAEEPTEKRPEPAPALSSGENLVIRFYDYYSSFIYLAILSSSEGKQKSLKQQLKFKFDEKQEKCVSQIELGKEWNATDTYITIERHTQGKAPERSKRQQVVFHNGLAEFDVHDWGIRPVTIMAPKETKTISRKKLFWWMGIAIALALIIGEIIGYNSTSRSKCQIEELRSSLTDVKNSLDVAYDSIKFYKSKLEHLQEDLKKEKPEAQSPPSPKVNEDLSVEYESRIVEAVNNRNWDKLNRLIQNNKNSLSPQEKAAIERFYFGKGRPYSSMQQRKIRTILSGHRFRNLKEIVRFSDEKIRSIVEE